MKSSGKNGAKLPKNRYIRGSIFQYPALMQQVALNLGYTSSLFAKQAKT